MNTEGCQLYTRQQFEKIFTEYYTELVVYLLKYVPESEVAEDIVQELFCDLWGKRKELHIHTDIRAFLFRSARNAVLNYLTRVRKITVAISMELENEMAFKEDLEMVELDRWLYSLIERLPEQRKRIFKMCFFEGVKYQEAAQKLNISVNTVKTQMGRALADLREAAGSLILGFILKKRG